MIRELAPAKVNLFLHVGNKRPDGYHELESLVAFASIGDELTFEPADALSLDVTGPFATALNGEDDNLVVRAARRFAELAAVKPNVQITLTKNLPVASGIGGGSSDAAATLRGLSRMWPGRTNLQALWNIGSELGSDAAVCVLPGCWWMSGRGERFASVRELGTFDALLVNAGTPVSTAQVYGGLRERTGSGKINRPQRLSTVRAVADYLLPARNDLQGPALQISPDIGEVLAGLANTGALLSRMSGSGGTCFGIYADPVSARAAAERLSGANPGWWVAPTKLNYGRTWEFQ